jgi:signal-transduction protein with cAMP-binding, CBS, and nucleotidyltransferase domain
MIGPEASALMQAQIAMQSWDRPRTGDWAKVLATLPLFSGVRKRRLRKLVRKATFAEFAPGEIIVPPGSTNSLYVILGGAAKTLEPEARPLGIGDYFGEVPLVERTLRSRTIVATRELQVMKVPRQAFLRLRVAHLTEQDRRRYGSARELVWNSD